MSRFKIPHMDGIIIIDKPAGWTSHDVVARARRILREKRIGHTGTLDPFATGVLVLLVGRATRLAQFLAGAEKEYEATIRLGFATDTGDLTGARLARAPAAAAVADCTALDAEKIEAALAALRGEIEQVPPMYSAKKVGGRKLYELARRGEEVERKAVGVRVGAFEVMPREDGALLRRHEDGTCDLDARVVCSAGTYIRALAESVGESLSTGAHLSALRRTRAGDFSLGAALGLEKLQALGDESAAGKILISMGTALSRFPEVHLTAEEARRARHGAAVGAAGASRELTDGEHVRVLDEAGELLAVGVYDAGAGMFRPRVMLAVEEK
ncbi:MAG: tRNA pseudouridine(55) synthase TruB [Acidobacteria bacterium]|nr:tRNA pseudouridine(55) synthase TruB [Acidobacteriota bacterium]